jgi:hypothetical protein
MSFKDKLELGLKPDAAYRPDNLPDFQKGDPACEAAAEPGESKRQIRARDACAAPVRAVPVRRRARAGTKAGPRPRIARVARKRR